MIKKISSLISILTVLAILICATSGLVVSADSAIISVSAKQVNVGDTVTVTVKYNSNAQLYAIDGSINFNSSVLQYVSGATNITGATAKIVEPLTGQTSKSYTLTFKAIAEGSSNITASVTGAGATEQTASAGTTITVTTPQPSSNANLSSIKLSSGSLTPSFKQNKTEYTATVKYSVEKITISANVADGNSTYVGGGTFDLNLGDNLRSLTVTAQSGAKKTYNVVIKRLSQEESNNLEQQERESDPLLVTVNQQDFHIVNDFTGVNVPTNLQGITTQYKSGEVNIVTDSAQKVKLFLLKSDDGAILDWYILNEDDKFERASYIIADNKIYIVEKEYDKATVFSSAWYSEMYELPNGTSVKAFKSSDKRMSDIYVLYCYYDGDYGYYRYDAKYNTVQRYPDFEIVEKVVNTYKSDGLVDSLMHLPKAGKEIVLLSIALVLCLLALLVLIIIKMRKYRTPKIKTYKSKTNELNNKD